jgi:hypothetical protein
MAGVALDTLLRGSGTKRRGVTIRVREIILQFEVRVVRLLRTNAVLEVLRLLKASHRG